MPSITLLILTVTMMIITPRLRCLPVPEGAGLDPAELVWVAVGDAEPVAVGDADIAEVPAPVVVLGPTDRTGVIYNVEAIFLSGADAKAIEHATLSNSLNPSNTLVNISGKFKKGGYYTQSG